MVRSKEVLAEFRREALRASSLWFAFAFAVGTLLLGVFAVSEDATDVYLSLVYLHLPLLFSPLAAYRGARCRERGLAAVAATAPSSLSSTLVGKLLALGALLVVWLAVSVPTSALFVGASQAGPTGSVLGSVLAWGLLLGLLAIAVGLLVGYARPGSTRAGVTISFVVFLAWLVFALQREVILSTADSALGRQLVQALLHASPLVWALEASVPGALGLEVSRQMAGPAVLAGGALAALVSTVLGLQHADGWRPISEVHPVAVVLLAGATLGVAGSLTVWDYPPPEAPGGDRPPEEVDVDPAAGGRQESSVSIPMLLPTGALAGLLAGASVWIPRRLNAWNT